MSNLNNDLIQVEAEMLAAMVKLMNCSESAENQPPLRRLRGCGRGRD